MLTTTESITKCHSFKQVREAIESTYLTLPVHVYSEQITALGMTYLTCTLNDVVIGQQVQTRR